jgi:hypothetical protein
VIQNRYKAARLLNCELNKKSWAGKQAESVQDAVLLTSLIQRYSVYRRSKWPNSVYIHSPVRSNAPPVTGGCHIVLAVSLCGEEFLLGGGGGVDFSETV